MHPFPQEGKGALVDTTFNNFKKMYDVCDTHAEREHHQDAAVACEALVQVMSGRQESVAVQLREGARATIQNRKKLQSMTETIMLCGRQNIPVRAHRDSSTDLEGTQSDSTNHGNFWALLNFRICAGDIFLRDHLHSAARNAMYTSPDIKNQLIKILGDHVRDKIDSATL